MYDEMVEKCGAVEAKLAERDREVERLRGPLTEVDIVFDGPPAHESGRFVEVERTSNGHGVSIGRWHERDDGLWALRISTRTPEEKPQGESSE